MAILSTYNLAGEKVKDREVSEKFLLLKPKASVVHQVLVAQMNNARRAIANTKDRSQVRGGGKKPWKQKGTGRARHGSIRSPLWIGGGVTFGPMSNRNFSQKVNKKMKQKALFMTMSDKVAQAKLFLLETLDLAAPKTKDVFKLFSKLPAKGKKTLVALPEKNQNFLQAVKNIPHITCVGVNSLNVRDILEHEYLVTTEQGVQRISTIYKQIKLKGDDSK